MKTTDSTSFAAIRQALSAARTQGHIDNLQLEKIAGFLEDAAMGLEMDADEMRAGSPVINRARSTRLGNLAEAFSSALSPKCQCTVSSSDGRCPCGRS